MTVRDRVRVIADRLRAEYRAERVILFGSHARGEAGPDSDVDLLLVAPTDERFFHRMATALRTVRDIGADLPLSPIVLTPEELEQRLAEGNHFVQDILRTGIEV